MQKVFSLRRHGIRVFAVLGLLSTLMTAAVSARGQELRLKVEVPFNFIVGKTILPAGEYVVRNGSKQDAMLIRSTDGRHRVSTSAALTTSKVSRDTGALAFNRYGEEYYLSRMWSPGTSGVAFPVSPRERALIAASEYLAKSERDVEVVTVHSAPSDLNISIVIPFEFVVGGEPLPAGNYTIRQSPLQRRQSLMILSVDGLILEGFSTNSVQRLMDSNLRLVFNQYGGQHFLSQIWAEGSGSGHALGHTNTEQELGKQARLTRAAQQLQVVNLPLR